MKKTSFFRIQFFARLSVITCLGLVGLLALTGEPADDAPFVMTFAAQLLVWAFSWLSAWTLYRHWHIGRVINRLKSLKN